MGNRDRNCYNGNFHEYSKVNISLKRLSYLLISINITGEPLTRQQDVKGFFLGTAEVTPP